MYGTGGRSCALERYAYGNRMFKHGTPIIALLAAAAVLVSACPVYLDAKQDVTEELVPGVAARSGMVVTACPHASAVGKSVLVDGGNAIDAAVAVGFALAVTFPAAGNIGGGGFMLVRMDSGETCFIDFREKAPAASHRDMYLDDDGEVIGGLSTHGHRAAGVPGSVAGLHRAHRLYGSKPWRELLAPAIDLATHGFPIDRHLAASLERLQPYRDQFPEHSAFMAADGTPLRTGDTLRQPDLSRVLSRLAEEGPRDFYSGETADLIVAEMKAGGGLITRQDLAAYSVMLREPVTGSYRGCELISASLPSSGGIVLLQILNILEGFPVRDLPFHSDRHIHIMVEAEKRAYADRARYLGDPDFVDIPVSRLLSKEYARYSRRSIGDRATPAARLNGGGLECFEHEETTHYSIVDRFGNAVATTTTLNGAFGSKVVVRGAGFLLNNEMDDFSIKPGVPNIYGLTGGDANEIEPEKRMLSSMTPTIVLRKGVAFLILGTPGGSTIITTVAQVIVNIIDFGMKPVDAVYAPRFHDQWLPDHISFEPGAFSAELVERLELRGHRCVERTGVIGDLQLILIDDTIMYGVADPRGGGKAEGIDTITPSR